MLALLGVLIQLFRGRNCFMRCEENSTDANPAISMVQINGTNSNPGTDFVVPINVTPSNLSTHLVSLSATNSSPSTNLVTPLNGLNNTSLMAPLSTTVPFVPMNATGSNPICSFSAPVNSSNSDPVIRCTTLMNAVNSN
ncbi:conserved hypothetical protein [Ricinus communis]|uniref:Uncharacterized protein n=1 Tax=Ricinus communis TaxID=3988 RepID=B9S2E2_RICCO|nr:conserved hypothetical protein [Ricinus communis]